MRKNALTTLLAPNWRLPERIPPWKWCEENVKNIPYSPIPGHFKSANSPWVREVMEAMADPDIRLVSIVAPVQSSKTIGAELCLCYIVANFPGPCLWLSQTDADAKDQAEARLHKLFSECDAVKKLFPADRHKKKTQTVFFSNGMTLWVLGAHAKSNLQSRSIRWLIGDETWQWPNGHMQQAEARVTAFGWLGKCIFLSQGGMGNDDTHRKFETTDMREWEFECPKCGKYQPYKWSNIEWDRNYRDGGGQIDFAKVRSSVRLVCEFCKHEIADSDANRKLLNSSAKFVPQNPNAPATKAGVPLEFAGVDVVGRTRRNVPSRKGIVQTRRLGGLEKLLPEASRASVGRLGGGFYLGHFPVGLPDGRRLGLGGRRRRKGRDTSAAARKQKPRKAQVSYGGRPDGPLLCRRPQLGLRRLQQAGILRETSDLGGCGNPAKQVRSVSVACVRRCGIFDVRSLQKLCKAQLDGIDGRRQAGFSAQGQRKNNPTVLFHGAASAGFRQKMPNALLEQSRDKGHSGAVTLQPEPRRGIDMGGSVRRSGGIPENARFGTAGEEGKFVGMAANRQASEPLLGLRGNAVCAAYMMKLFKVD